MRPLHDVYDYRYRGPTGNPATCWLRIFETATGHTVILTEHRHNEGISVTNAAERLAAQVCTEYGLAIDKAEWFEHYPPASYRRVRFEGGRPQWHAPGADGNPFVERLTVRNSAEARGR